MKEFLSQTANLNRAIVSDDFLKTLNIIGKRISLTIHKYGTGTQCFDWIIPKKWSVRGAYIETLSGKRILDWKNNPLHIVIGSLPVKRKKIARADLLKKIYVSNEYPSHIPYQFKYYELDWGFCMSKDDAAKLSEEEYWIEIDSEYTEGNLLVGEHVIEGESEKSIVLLSHIDHPGQVNDGLAGAAVLLALAEELKGYKPTYTIRMQFLSETIGSIAHLHNHQKIIPQILGAIFLEMPGTPAYPMVLQHSKQKNSRLDLIAAAVLRDSGEKVEYAECFKHVVNDDGFYNSPGIDVPCISLSRSKKLSPENWYHFPYYHTSGDSIENFDIDAAQRYLKYLKEILEIANADRRITKKYQGIPNLSRHGLWIDWRLYPKASQAIDSILFSLDDGVTIFDVAELTGVPFEEVNSFVKKLEEKDLVSLSIVV